MNLDKALEIAVKSHQGQKDKVGNPYILHPLRIMMRMKGEDEMIVAILHPFPDRRGLFPLNFDAVCAIVPEGDNGGRYTQGHDMRNGVELCQVQL
jgi:hypothetical protein